MESLGLSTVSVAVYQAMLEFPSFGVEQLSAATQFTPSQIHDGLEELGQLMLVRSSAEHPGQLRAVSPDLGLADLLARQEADLAARQARIAASRAAVAEIVAQRADLRPANGERLLGIDAIQDRLEQMGRGARTEVLGVHPGASQRPEDLAAARMADEPVLARGVVIRTLLQEATRNDPHTSHHANWLLGRGGQVRTAHVLPQRLVIVDRAQALVPIDPADSRKGALHITEPGLLIALLNLFEQTWQTAVPLGATRPEDPESGLTDTERELLRLLGNGLTDDAAGQRLGVSSRTIGRHMASIMERLGAGSRFEAGIKAAQNGWL
ncbi:LuxR C-terminal-related transcriptional regulator [Kitasatospora sp. NPDC006697]|uniref:helix-turn-helix transcriptional regulator n=1 Tax=Kitasatospora sp. NPDC006697 TaxID=3364020 RepID=UPI0036BE7804